MGETLQVQIDSSKDVVQPTLQEEAAKYDNPSPISDPDRPSWLPEKFKSAEDLAKAYGELERKLGSRSADTPEPSEQSADPAKPDATESEETLDNAALDAAKKATAKAGLDFDELSHKYWKGGLDDADYSKLDKSGIPKFVVDQFIAGQEALLKQTTDMVFNSVGGKDNYSTITQWASDNLDKPEIDAFNRAVNSGDSNVVVMAVKGLKARYDTEVGFEPQRQVKGSTTKAGLESYRSIAELQRDMGDARYKSDPAFRRDVEQKLARSDIF